MERHDWENVTFYADLSERDEELLQRITHSQEAWVTECVRYLFADIANSCQSDIEAMMGIALCLHYHDRIRGRGRRTRDFIRPQFGIYPFALDFLVTPEPENPRICVGVECDGKAYHSSPKQKKRDRFRDWVISKYGVLILRFTGTEIYRAPTRCVAKIEDRLRWMNNQASPEVFERDDQGATPISDTAYACLDAARTKQQSRSQRGKKRDAS